jgi:hypothetical protein
MSALFGAAGTVFPRDEEGRYAALLKAANTIASASDCDGTSEAVIRSLHEIASFDFLHLVAYDKDTDQPCFSLLESDGQRMEAPAADAFSLANRRFTSCTAPGNPW